MSFGSDQPLITNQISDVDFPEDLEDFLEVFGRQHKKIVDVVNSKEGALYQLEEQATYQKYFKSSDSQETRNVYRKVFNIGALPNSGTKRVQHGINLTNTARVTRLYGGATDPSSIQFIPLPFASPTLANNISLEADETDIIITTGSDRTTFSDVTVVFEYTKDV